MRAVYRNPKELATYLKDLVDSYSENLITYEKLEEKVLKIVEANGDRVYRDGFMVSKIEIVIGESRKEIIDKIVKQI
ncbi:TIGR04540 family protein [Clostridium frigidicarnis]|uniref:Uncharacterized protein n=1 Tax=Clostridium frigidicarnis TaxID=84698 RepID=A0A1I0UYC2_9CLOT|nr:TIGR04540 family protein [Clostridium frigidicarnis]SFA69074.1 conserved hypothetical protein [Clostridium frigidicarnis]